MTRHFLNTLVFILLVFARHLLFAGVDNPNPFGVGTSAEASGQYASWMPKMGAAKLNSARCFPDWNAIQPSAGTWSWTLMDSMINTASNNNLSVSGLFLYNAKWVNTNNAVFPTNNLAAWSTYVSNVVRHAAGRVRYWEVWNEPENFSPKGTAADYACIVTNAYNAAKAADPSAQIGLSVASVDILYLEQAIQAGAADHFDYICVHPYEVLGTVAYGQEALFMNVVPTIRKMLAVKNPAKWKVPIWFTEIGEGLGGQVTAISQAQDLVKTYTMSIAQGVSRIEWFEAQEGGYSMGLLNSSGNPNPAYTALKNLTAVMGTNPVYTGWLLLNSQDYGFVFKGATNSVMAVWAPQKAMDTVFFDQKVAMLEPLSGLIVSSNSCSLSNAPLLVVGLPSNLVAQAQSNRTLPFPWGGDFTGVSSVSVSMGSPNVEKGLHQLKPDATSTATTVSNSPARDCSKSGSQTFTIDPNFLCYTHASIKITAAVRKISASDNPGFNLKYESATGRKGIGWNSVPGSDKWYTLSWTISDDEFVGDWGFHFSFDSDSTNYSRYYLQQVTVTNLIARPASSPTGSIATPGVGQIALSWNSVPGATGYTLKRAGTSHGPYEVIAPTLTSLGYVDCGLTPGVNYYYVLSAINSGGPGPDSAEFFTAPLFPNLSILLTDSMLHLNWPTSAIGFSLQESAIISSNSWANFAAPVQLQGSDLTAVVSPVDRTKFYRLSRGISQ